MTQVADFIYFLLGLCLFWKHDYFATLSDSIVTLFSLSQGDVVLDVFKKIQSEGLISKFFLVTFMMLFFTSIQNVLILIIMEGYEISRIVKKYEWAALDRPQAIEKVHKLRGEFEYDPKVDSLLGDERLSKKQIAGSPAPPKSPPLSPRRRHEANKKLVRHGSLASDEPEDDRDKSKMSFQTESPASPESLNMETRKTIVFFLS